MTMTKAAAAARKLQPRRGGRDRAHRPILVRLRPSRSVLSISVSSPPAGKDRQYRHGWESGSDAEAHRRDDAEGVVTAMA